MGAPHGTALVGRDTELAQLGRFLDAPEDFPRALLLEGEAGIGKTTLWRAGIEICRERSYPVLSCRASPAEAQIAFGALAFLIEDTLDEVLPHLPAPQRRALRIALLLDEPSGPPPDQRATFTAVLGLLRRLAHDGPVVVAVDDIHFLDPPTASVLEFVAHRLEASPIAFLLTLRAGMRQELVEGLEHGFDHDRFEHLAVGPLSLGELYHVLRDRLGTSFPRSTLRRIHEGSRGNALLALEIAGALREHGGELGVAEQLPVPTVMRELLTARIQRLPSATRQVLLAVAASAEPTIGLLERAIGSEARACLEPAFESHVLEWDEDRCRFSHPLLSSAVYSNAGTTDRRSVHGLLAGAEHRPEVRARHLALAAEGPDPEVADALDEAAATAATRGLPVEAADLTELAVRLTPPGRMDDTRRRQVAAGEYRFLAGDHDRARTLLEGVADVANPGAIRARAAFTLALLRVHESGPAAGVRSLLDAVEAVRDEPLLYAILQVEVAELLYQSGDVRAGEHHAHLGLALARRAGNDEVASYAMAVTAWITFLLGQGYQAELLARIPASGEGTPERAIPYPTFLGMQPTFIDACLLKWSDEFSPARAKLEDLRRHYLDGHEETLLGPILFQLAEMEIWAGNWTDAEWYAKECREARFRSRKHSDALYLTLEAGLAALRGLAEAAQELAERALAITEEADNVPFGIRNLSILGSVELLAGDAIAAHPYFERATSMALQAGYIDPGLFRFQADAIGSLVAIGEIGRAEEMVDQLAAFGAEMDRPWPMVAAARGRGSIHAAAGDLDAASSALEDALGHHERLEMPFERGRTLLAMGVALRRARRKRQARDSLEQALATFEQLGAVPWVERARSELERIGGRASSPLDLTPAERRVAELVSTGLSNKGVAAQLVVSVHTVESHLSSVYTKLGVRSRTELTNHMLTKTG